ncbi:hypothetical protein GTW69_40270 [Streptomyces sp. SID7760]|nr:hypothetical protein [Streptomyces sp. SID7760]
MDLKDSQQLHGYTYANQNPFTFWDPSGKQLEECASGMYKCHNGNDPYAYGNRYETIVDSVGGTLSDDYLRYRHYGCVDFACKRGSSGSSSTSRPAPPKAPKPPKKHDFSWSNPVSEAFYGIIGNVAHASSMFGWIADGDCWNGGAGAPGCDYGGDYEEWLQDQGIDTSSDWYQVPVFLGAMFSHREAGVGGGIRGGKGGQCFLAGTLVLMSDGSTKKIEDVDVGDQVLATDPRSGESAPHEVTQLIRSQGLRDLNTLSIEMPSGVEELTATRDHPFWSPSVGGWVHAGDVSPGTTLLTDQGAEVRVSANRAFTEFVKTYNFTVSDVHTYYVLAGETPILVHNSCEVAERGLWQLTKEGSTKIQKGGPFKTTFYKSASDGTWWTPDVTGHGESAFKVYRETSKGLEWISDADKYGDYMPEKWKGDTGKFIPNSNLRGVKK